MNTNTQKLLPSIIRPLGKFLAVDQDGYFVNEASWAKVAEPWRRVVLKARDVYVEQLGVNLHSVYVRGSVAQGTAVEGVSDVDTIALVIALPPKDELEWLPAARQALAVDAPFSTGVELEVRELAKILEQSKLQFILKVQSACIVGGSIAARLPDFGPSLELGRELYDDFPQVLERAKQRLAEAPTDAARKKWCRWAMKRIIRRAAAIMMPETGKYSRDLYPTYQLFAEQYPHQAEDMRQALEWAIEPIAKTEATLELIDRLGEFLVSEAAKQLY